MVYRCPCCGFIGLTVPAYANLARLSEGDPLPRGIEPPYRQHFGEASYDVCPKCKFEFGYDDEPVLGMRGSSFEEYTLKRSM